MRHRLSRVLIFAFIVVLPVTRAAADDVQIDRGAHSRMFPILASTYAVLNGLDVYTTTAVIRSGSGVEANPLVAPAAGNPFALAALKAVSTTATIVVARRLWKRHPAGAIALLVGANIGMGLVVSHNARVAGGF